MLAAAAAALRLRGPTDGGAASKAGTHLFMCCFELVPSPTPVPITRLSRVLVRCHLMHCSPMLPITVCCVLAGVLALYAPEHLPLVGSDADSGALEL
eukprot:gene2984-3553_t